MSRPVPRFRPATAAAAAAGSSISPCPSKIRLPDHPPPYPSIPEFLAARFPRISRQTWDARITRGTVLAEDGTPLEADSAYLPGALVYYFREVDREPVIPLAEEVIFRNDHLLVACKPHFLPVTPGGAFVNECLLNRLRRRLDLEYLAPIHRIDRDTAGLVMFSVNRSSNGRYHELFRQGLVRKSYQAVARLGQEPPARGWLVQNRLVPGEPWFRMKQQAGPCNAQSRIRLVERRGGQGLFDLQPLTGQTHQLRVHMAGQGCGILNDRLYPQLELGEDDFERPLQLVARQLSFTDPVCGTRREFRSERPLMLW